MNQPFISNVLIALSIAGSIVVWGISLERELAENTTSLELLKSVQKVLWKESDRRLQDLEKALLRHEEKSHEEK